MLYWYVFYPSRLRRLVLGNYSERGGCLPVGLQWIFLKSRETCKYFYIMLIFKENYNLLGHNLKLSWFIRKIVFFRHIKKYAKLCHYAFYKFWMLFNYDFFWKKRHPLIWPVGNPAVMILILKLRLKLLGVGSPQPNSLPPSYNTQCGGGEGVNFIIL